ncbi:hypothetical protein B0H63DRAFT_518376 [Podospora didyma]|uniref:Uncharacterized protein n=1 Tax=Podospora didyma TaxID=330526 RepID=A0AAE0U931_9PEZI|nr:hypothetical protein B0H63DRAFT_518376 [Podospora didyma]
MEPMAIPAMTPPAKGGVLASTSDRGGSGALVLLVGVVVVMLVVIEVVLVLLVVLASILKIAVDVKELQGTLHEAPFSIDMTYIGAVSVSVSRGYMMQEE